MTFEMPEYITAGAEKEWNRLLDYMQESGFAEEQYMHTYASYCLAVAHIEEAINTIEAEGLTVEGKNESLVKHPAFTILKEATDRMLVAAKLFGFVPRALDGKEPTKYASNNPLEQLRSERAQRQD